jgi:hypothetical protein
MTRAGEPRLIWAGIVAGPLAWALSTELGLALAQLNCTGSIDPIPWIVVSMTALAVAGGLISWRAWSAVWLEDPQSLAPRRFVAGLGVGAAALFAFTVLMQGAAALFFDGCLL